MKIKEIHIYQKSLPVVDGPYTMGGVEVHALDSTIVKLVMDNGRIGWGETCPLDTTYQPEHALGARAALQELSPSLIGQEATAPLRIWRLMNGRLNGHNYAKAAIDIAIYDALGKTLGLPVSELLGGRMMDSVPSYYALGINSPDETARLAEEKKRQGYQRLQLKIGGRSVHLDIETIRKTWENLGPDIKLVADANRSLTMQQFRQISLACADIPLTFEQPCNTLEEMMTVRPQIQHPIFLDENTVDLNTVLRAVSLGACDGFGFKVTRLGGLTPMTTVRGICEAKSLPHTCDDAWGGDIIAAACVHLGATVSPKLLEGVWIAAPYIEGHYDEENGIVVKNGRITVPTRPGLGINPGETLFEKPLTSFG